jgi:pyruvate kinase
MLERATAAVVECGLAERGDLIVITAGVPVGIAGHTNLIKVQKV